MELRGISLITIVAPEVAIVVQDITKQMGRGAK